MADEPIDNVSAGWLGGLYRWLTRKRAAHTPGWMQSLGKLTPTRAGLAAAALTVVNPKVLFMCAAAGFAIAPPSRLMRLFHLSKWRGEPFWK